MSHFTVNPLKIMIIEDDTATRHMLDDAFSGYGGHEVHCATGCRQALSLLHTHDGQFDAILLDYRLPDGTGLDFYANLLNSAYKDIAVIMLSGESSREVLIEFLKMGGADFVAKPIQDLMVLEAIVRHAVNLNITERHFKQAELEKMAALESKKFMEDFVAKLAHELGTPLHHLKSAVNIGLKEIQNGDTHKAVEWLTLASKSNLRMTRLVNDISDLSRLQRGKLSLRKRTSNISEIVNISIKESITRANDFDGEIKTHIENHPIYCDPERLSQVFINLLNNAFTHAQDCKKITISVKKEGNDLLCSVSDDGKIDKNTALETLFEPFSQGADSYNSSGNLGIGLSICKDLIALHEGQIKAQPNPFKGLSIQFTLPLGTGA